MNTIMMSPYIMTLSSHDIACGIGAVDDVSLDTFKDARLLGVYRDMLRDAVRPIPHRDSGCYL